MLFQFRHFYSLFDLHYNLHHQITIWLDYPHHLWIWQLCTIDAVQWKSDNVLLPLFWSVLSYVDYTESWKLLRIHFRWHYSLSKPWLLMICTTDDFKNILCQRQPCLFSDIVKWFGWNSGKWWCTFVSVTPFFSVDIFILVSRLDILWSLSLSSLLRFVSSLSKLDRGDSRRR